MTRKKPPTGNKYDTSRCNYSWVTFENDRKVSHVCDQSKADPGHVHTCRDCPETY